MQPQKIQPEELLDQIKELVPQQNLETLGLQFYKLKLEFSKQKDAMKRVEVDNRQLQKRLKEKDQECRKLKKQQRKLRKELQISQENISRLTLSKRTKTFNENSSNIEGGASKKNQIQKVYPEEKQEKNLIVQHNINEKIIKKIRSENMELIKKLENLQSYNRDLSAENTALKLYLEKVVEMQKLGSDDENVMAESDNQQDSIDIDDDYESYFSSQAESNNLEAKKSATAKLQDIEEQDEDNEKPLQKRVINDEKIVKEANQPELTKNNSSATQDSFIKKFSTKLKQWWHICDK